MRRKINPSIPRYNKLINPTLTALKDLGGSGTIDEILNHVIKALSLSNDIVDEPHGDGGQSELQYQLAWARTYLKKAGVAENTARGIWVIKSEFKDVCNLDEKELVKDVVKKVKEKRVLKESPENLADDFPENDGVDYPEEAQSWRIRLSEVLHTMDPFAFERLSQRVLRECGFTQVEVTKKSGDGGIDGTGKLRINGIFSFNVAFQCKRFKNQVSASYIRDFRGSLTTDIEKGVLITTGTFSRQAREEASNPGKQQIDLIDGEEFISKIAEYGIGVKEVKSYEIDEDFFKKI